jgi:hypothetical protein
MRELPLGMLCVESEVAMFKFGKENFSNDWPGDIEDVEGGRIGICYVHRDPGSSITQDSDCYMAALFEGNPNEGRICALGRRWKRKTLHCCSHSSKLQPDFEPQ